MNQLPADSSGDPGDRLIAATALAERIAVVTDDLRIRARKQIMVISRAQIKSGWRRGFPSVEHSADAQPRAHQMSPHGGSERWRARSKRAPPFPLKFLVAVTGKKAGLLQQAKKQTSLRVIEHRLDRFVPVIV